MKKSLKTMAGVTLLEVMLVLAIAAMIIVMSIRYYQSASTSQQANAVISQITAIVAAADSLSQAEGSYANVTEDTLKNLLPESTFSTPWGGKITVKGATSSIDINVQQIPIAVCTLVSGRLKLNNHFTAVPDCGSVADGTFTYTFNA